MTRRFGRFSIETFWTYRKGFELRCGPVAFLIDVAQLNLPRVYWGRGDRGAWVSFQIGTDGSDPVLRLEADWTK